MNRIGLLLCGLFVCSLGYKSEAQSHAPGMRRLPASPWPMARGDAQRSGRAVGSGAVGEVLWEYAADSPATDAPVLGPDGTVYLSLRGGTVCALDGATGAKQWEFAAWAPLFAGPAVGPDGTVYLGATEGALYALDGATGEKRWTFRIRNAARAPEEVLENLPPGVAPTVKRWTWDKSKGTWEGYPGRPGPNSITHSPVLGAEGALYVMGGDDFIYALDGATGRKRWETLLYRGLTPALSPRGDRLYVKAAPEPVDEPLNYLCAFETAAGSLRWKQNPSLYGPVGDQLNAVAVGPDGTVFVTGSYIGSNAATGNGGALLAFPARGGQPRWKREMTTGSGFTAPALGAEGTVFVGTRFPQGSRDARLFALDGATGETRWEFASGGSYVTPPSLGADGTVYIGSMQKVYALDGRTGRVRWSLPVSGYILSSLAIGADGALYFSTTENRVYAVR